LLLRPVIKGVEPLIKREGKEGEKKNEREREWKGGAWRRLPPSKWMASLDSAVEEGRKGEGQGGELGLERPDTRPRFRVVPCRLLQRGFRRGAEDY